MVDIICISITYIHVLDKRQEHRVCDVIWFVASVRVMCAIVGVMQRTVLLINILTSIFWHRACDVIWFVASVRVMCVIVGVLQRTVLLTDNNI